METKLSKQFKSGLKDVGLKYEDMGDWKYCGGDTGRHLNYFILTCPNDDKPPHDNKCVCGHDIIENCYITDGDNILVLGNCCIKRFLKKSGRTCSLCEKPHRNQIVDRCNECRVGLCDGCGKECDPSYKKCRKCYFK
jgi:hypothetical protein